MTNNNFFIWDASPNIISTGEFHIPFPISIAALIFSAVIYYFASDYLKKHKLKKHPENSQRTGALPALWSLGLIIGSLVIGQILTIPTNLLVIHTVGPITIRWYGVIFAIAFILGRFIEIIRQVKENLS